MQITIATNKTALKSFVFSLDNAKALTLPALYFGDIFNLEIEASNGVGGYADFTGRADVVLTAGVGLPESRTNYASTILTYASGGLYAGTLNLNATALSEAITGQDKIKAFFEVNASYYGGDKQTILQMPVTINNQLIT